MTLVDLFATSVRRVPERPAIIFRDRRLTYRDLHGMAGAAAGLLGQELERQALQALPGDA